MLPVSLPPERVYWELQEEAGGASYRLCWCAAQSPCGPENFVLDIGRLQMMGPKLQQSRTCTSGQRCSFEQLEGHLKTSDLIAVLDTCGTPLLPLRLPEVGRLLTYAGHESWGSISLSAPGGRYRLCWCATSLTPCNTTDHFKVDAGELLVLGPSLQQERTCIGGQSCALDLTSELLPDFAVMVLDTCGVEPLEPLEPWYVASSGAARDLVAPAGQYRLCWCAFIDACTVTGDFRTDFGTLTVLGPVPLEQSSTCVSGRACSVGMGGLGLVPGDQVVVLATCSELMPVSGFLSPATVHAAEGFLAVSKAPSSWALLTWDAISAPGGKYRLCWCPHGVQAARCSESAGRRLDFGSLTVIGPSLLAAADRTCISGQTCEVDSIPGVYLQSSDRVAVLQTCGTSQEDGDWIRTGYPLVPPALEGGGASIAWAEELTGPGGQYRLCWCAGYPEHCQLQSDFLVDFAGLHVLGPRPLHQDRTCISGVTCFLESFAGEGLSPMDGLWMLETCGEAGDAERFVPVDELRKSESAILLKGGQYRLCWCHGLASDCSLFRDFRVDIGRLDLIGMAPLQQDRTCVSGHRCTIDGLTGHYLEASNQLLVLETCGFVPRPEKLAAYLWVAASGASFGWHAALTSPGGEYRLCWCAGSPDKNWTSTVLQPEPLQLQHLGNQTLLAPNHTRGSCELPGDFRLDFGKLTLLGPSPLFQDRTCISGEICRIGSLQGRLSESDHLVLMDTCADETTRRTTPSQLFGALSMSGDAAITGSPLTFAAGEYRLCWCAGHWPCESFQDFATDFGRLQLLGPAPLHQHRTCVSGHTCMLRSFEGFGLSGGHVLVLDTCGVGKAIDRFSLAGMVREVLASGSQMVWASVTARGGIYRLCWRDAPHDANATYMSESAGTPSDFRVDMGSLTVVGPSFLDQDRTCVSGRTCQIDGLQGFHFSMEDTVLVLDTCALGTLAPLWPETGYGVEVTAAGAVISWGPAPVSAPGGQYRLCWCAGAREANASFSLGLCGHDDFTGTRGLVDMGGMLLVGVSPLKQHRTCIAGQTCAVDGIEGRDLSTQDRFLVADTCGITGAIHRFAGFGSATSVEQSGSLALVDFGRLQLVGPLPLSQHRTCISGQSCNVERITGVDLSSQHDRIMVLETCGTQSSLARFPEHGVTSFSGDQNGSAPLVTAAGGSFRLCWCSGLRDESCANLLETHVDIGELRLIGLMPLSQDRTCVSGQTCSFSDISGVDLPNESHILVLQTCATASFVPGFPAAKMVRNASSQELQVYWDTAVTSPAGVVPRFPAFAGVEYLHGSVAGFLWGARVSAAGGVYQLCWCAARSFACAAAEEFRVNLGELLLLGPSPLSQTRTCVSGRACRVPPLEGSDTVFLLDTCGISRSSQEDGWISQGFTGNASVALWNAEQQFIMPGDSAVSSATGDWLTVTWGSIADRTCIAGQFCDLSAVYGTFLSPSDSFAILDTCGHNLVAGFPFDSLLVTQPSTGVVLVSWGDQRVTSAGGDYRLCWCASTGNSSLESLEPLSTTCGGLSEYRTDLGRMMVIGPAPLQQGQTCVSGQTCIFDAPAGHLVSELDTFQILDTCGFEGSLPGFPSSIPQVDFTRGSPSLTWAIPVTAYGGLYRICWCATGLSCSSAEDFELDAGELLLIGIAEVEGSLYNLQFHMAGGVYRLCWCAGINLWPDTTTGNRLIVLDTCSMDAARAPLPNSAVLPYVTVEQAALTENAVLQASWGADRTCVQGQICMVMGITGESLSDEDRGIYKLCWCSGSFECSLSEDFRVDAGTSGASIDFGSSFATAAGGVYRLCWCSGHFGCQLPSDFRVQLGELTLLGMSPLFQDKTCISGQTCTIHGLLGQDLSDASRVMVLDSCGTAELVPKLVLDGLATGVTDNGASVTWGSVPMTPPGGKYRLCWCAEQSNSTNLTWSARCKDPLNFAQDVGTMTLVGASPLRQDFTCVVGSLCSVRAVSGEGLSAADSVMLLDTCGTGNIPDRFPVDSNISNISNNALRYMTGPYFNIIWQTAITAPGGQYRLCWCSSAAPCSTAEHFRLDFGSLTLAGPSPLLQHHTCTAGRSCARPAVAVYPRDLDVGEVVVLSTCSYQSSWAPDGFPHRGQLLANTSELVTAGGGHYTLCWNPARDSSNRLGHLFIAGPSPLGQDRTCISGHTCFLSGFLGDGLSLADEIRVMDTCGVDAAVPRAPRAGHFVEVSQSGSAVSWGPAANTAAGGQYRLCWWSGTREVGNATTVVSEADTPNTDFVVDVGKLDVI
ncbi:unnamed protein product, partial [Effrenium voratum]